MKYSSIVSWLTVVLAVSAPAVGQTVPVPDTIRAEGVPAVPGAVRQALNQQGRLGLGLDGGTVDLARIDPDLFATILLIQSLPFLSAVTLVWLERVNDRKSRQVAAIQRTA